MLRVPCKLTSSAFHLMKFTPFSHIDGESVTLSFQTPEEGTLAWFGANSLMYQLKTLDGWKLVPVA